MTHLEALIAEYLDWRGYLVRRNIKVGRLKHGGWEMELDIVAYHPQEGKLVHFEPSIDADSWTERERRYTKKFGSGERHILSAVFPWLPPTTEVHRFAVFINHPKNRDEVAGGKLISVDELVADIRKRIHDHGPACSNAIAEQYPMLRTMQLSHCGYDKVVKDGLGFV